MEAKKSVQEATGPDPAGAKEAMPTAGSLISLHADRILPTNIQCPGKEIAKTCMEPVKKTLVVNMTGA